MFRIGLLRRCVVGTIAAFGSLSLSAALVVGSAWGIHKTETIVIRKPPITFPTTIIET